MSRKAYSKPKKKPAASNFYEVPKESDRNDKAVLVSALQLIIDVIMGFRTEFDCVCSKIESTNQSKKADNLESLKCLVVSFGKFYENWLLPFSNALEGDLSCFANCCEVDSDKHAPTMWTTFGYHICVQLYTK